VLERDRLDFALFDKLRKVFAPGWDCLNLPFTRADGKTDAPFGDAFEIFGAFLESIIDEDIFDFNVLREVGALVMNFDYNDMAI
jgi:hypothetical protein